MHLYVCKQRPQKTSNVTFIITGLNLVVGCRSIGLSCINMHSTQTKRPTSTDLDIARKCENGEKESGTEKL